MSNPITNSPLWRWLRGRPTPPSQDRAAAVGAPPTLSSRRFVDTQGDDCCGVSDIGKVREGNEDVVLVAPEQGLLVIADGLGGHAAGEVASALIVRTVFQVVTHRLVRAAVPPQAIIGAAFKEAENAVSVFGREHPQCRGMGATVIVALITGDQVMIGHVGDTRGYLSRRGSLLRLTNDHTLVGRLLRAGLLTEDEVRKHPDRNTVTQAVMGERDIQPEYNDVVLEDGDCLMLCSDGLWDEIPHDEIGKILADPAPAWEIATRLVDCALAAGGNDNVTAAIYRHRKSKREPAPM